MSEHPPMVQPRIDFRRLWKTLKAIDLITDGQDAVFGGDEKGYDWRDDFLIGWVRYAWDVFEDTHWGVNRVRPPRFNSYCEALLKTLREDVAKDNLSLQDVKEFEQKLPTDLKSNAREFFDFSLRTLKGFNVLEDLDAIKDEADCLLNVIYGFTDMAKGLEILYKLEQKA